jgi:hypothetical protein
MAISVDLKANQPNGLSIQKYCGKKFHKSINPSERDIFGRIRTSNR